MKKILFPILLSIASVSVSYAGNTQTLVTKSFTIDITSHCEEGEVSCNKVDYLGKRNGKPGEQIRLRGRTLALNGGQGRFIGYEFRNGAYTYRVLEEGQLQILRGKKMLQNEQGAWK